jgi:spore coat protein U-like protein
MHRIRSTVMLVRAALAGGALLFCATAAEAQGLCRVSTTSVNFGTYNVFATAANDSTGSITLNCLSIGSVAVAINRGGASTFAPRRMVKSTEALHYNLYLDAARTIIWGDGSSGTQMHIEVNPPLNQDVTLTMFARIPASQDVSAGSYSDSVTVTVNY